MSIHIPKAPDGQRLGRHIYIIRRNCTLWFWRHKNFATSNWLSKTKQRERLMRCIVYSPHWLQSVLWLLSIWCTIYLHRRGAFGVARFDNQGNAKAFMAWNEWQTGSTFLFVYQYTEEYEHAIRMPDGVKTPYYGTKYIYGFCGVLRPYP